ncbi:hypothetical protein VTJ04DRAFT_4761 [Mycothermus thermophilus]|uniref:uncharacterized protein n=1 Tax=Humicola insolens TaxID=85995 RepID=UPI0037437639
MSLPPSSPRLPSPPPPAEIQITPQSPLMGPKAAQIEQTAIDTNSKRRIHKGTRSCDMAAGPPLVPLHELDSPFQLQEHLAALHYYHTNSKTTPVSRETAKLLATPPQGTDKTLWLYELCRFLIAQCNTLIVGFLFDSPACSAATCPEMRAGEWQFLCAVHDTPKSCCAIDYCCHTLDWAANVVTNPKIFPSRFVVDSHDKSTAVKNLVNIFRRLHRIFAHAWFQHRGVFWSLENQTGLYIFFKTVCDMYDLLPAENYKLPPEAEGLDPLESTDKTSPEGRQPPHPITIARPPAHRDLDPVANRTNTRRHIKSSPSVGSAVATVPEADEEDSANDLSNRLKGMRISPSRSAQEDADLSTIPVIVENATVAPERPSSVIPPAAGTSPENRLIFTEQKAAETAPIAEPTQPAAESTQQSESSPPPPSAPADISDSTSPPSSSEGDPIPAPSEAEADSRTDTATVPPQETESETTAEEGDAGGEEGKQPATEQPPPPPSRSSKKEEEKDEKEESTSVAPKPDKLSPPDPTNSAGAADPEAESPVDKTAAELGLFVTSPAPAPPPQQQAASDEKEEKPEVEA